MIEDRETAIVGRLNGAVDNADCKPFPRNPESYRHSGREAEIFVSFRGSRPARAPTTDFFGREMIETWDVHLVTRDLRSHNGAYGYLDGIRRRLHGWDCPEAASPMAPTETRFVSQKDGLWTYVATFEQRIMVVADPGGEDLPLLKRVTTIDDEGETNVTESEEQ